MSTSTPRLLTLPVEILVDIFTCCDYDTVQRLMRVHSLIKGAIFESPEHKNARRIEEFACEGLSRPTTQYGSETYGRFRRRAFSCIWAITAGQPFEERADGLCNDWHFFFQELELHLAKSPKRRNSGRFLVRNRLMRRIMETSLKAAPREGLRDYWEALSENMGLIWEPSPFSGLSSTFLSHVEVE